MSLGRRQADLEPAYLLHSRPYRETSALLELLTESHGRVGAVARGARGPKSRLKGLLQPFVPLLVSWQGRGELVTLTGAEPGGRPGQLRAGALAGGFYLNELLVRLLKREDPHPSVLEAYRQALGDLAGGAPLEPVVRRFEKRLLDDMGYGLPLAEDAEGRPVRAEVRYLCQPDRLPQPTASPHAGISGASLLALAGEGELSEAMARELRDLLRSALRPHLGPRPLKSRELYRQLAQTPANPQENEP